jgi:hypothetical protein
LPGGGFMAGGLWFWMLLLLCFWMLFCDAWNAFGATGANQRGRTTALARQ